MQSEDRRREKLWRAFWQLPLAEKLQYGRLLVLAVTVEAAVRAMPIGLVTRTFGIETKWTAPDLAPKQADLRPSELRDVYRTLRIMRNWPFADASCLRQAIMVSLLLRRHSPVLCLGIGKDPSGMLAHAWVELRDGSIGGPGDYIPFRARTS
jgi:hypothetical protein